MKELSLFTGMGGGIYGSLILGWETIAYVERDAYCQQVIKQRINDGWFDAGDIYGDIREFNKKHAQKYTEKIDIITGGFPCQPFSVAGKRKGTSDNRYLFDEIIKTIKIIRPKQLFFENVRGLLTDPAIINIYRQLERLGYNVKPVLLLGSDDCGNIHRRKRVWILANANLQRKQGFGKKTFQRQSSLQRCENIRSHEDLLERPDIPKPLLCRVDDELSDWKQRLKAIGNGQDPIVMATAYLLLSDL